MPRKVIPLQPDRFGFVAKNLADYSEKGFDLVRDGDSASALWDAEVKAFIDAATLKSLFFTEDWIYIVIDLIASKVSGQTLRVMTESVIDGRLIAEPDEGHPLNDLLQNPNPWQDYHSFMYNVAVELMVLGNAITWYAQNSRQLVTLPAEIVTLDFDRAGKLARHLLHQNRQELRTSDRGSATAFDPREIIHVRRPNPSSLLWGLSPLVPGRKSILFNRYSSDKSSAPPRGRRPWNLQRREIDWRRDDRQQH